MRKTSRGIIGLFVLLTSAGCASRRPVLYPNEQLQRVGTAAAERDIDDCMRRAEAFTSTSTDKSQAAKDVAGTTAVGGASGAAIGAVGGAVTGNAGQGAAVGAATGATAGFLHGMFGVFKPREPSPIYASFVDRCLRERGYDPIGWQ
jgi:outer membrane lipoprotein SlyB